MFFFFNLKHKTFPSASDQAEDRRSNYSQVLSHNLTGRFRSLTFSPTVKTHQAAANFSTINQSRSDRSTEYIFKIFVTIPIFFFSKSGFDSVILCSDDKKNKQKNQRKETSEGCAVVMVFLYDFLNQCTDFTVIITEIMLRTPNVLIFQIFRSKWYTS